LNHCASMKDAPRRTAALASSRAWCMTFARQLHADTDNAWNTALNFAELSGDVRQHLSVISGKAMLLIYTGRYEQAVSLLDVSSQIAQTGDRALMFDTERLVASAEMHLGKLLDAQSKLKRLAEELAHGMPPSRITRYQEQRYVSTHTALAFSTWLTGQPGRALAMSEEMVLKTGRIGQLIGQSHILALVAMPLALWSGQIDALERYSTILRGNLDRENIALWEPVHRFYASVIRHARGDLDVVDDMQSAVDELVRDRFLLRTPMYLGVLAVALLERGSFANAHKAVEFAFTLQRQSNENWCLPELLRVKAQTMAALGEKDPARAMLARARENALTIGARTLELRILNDMVEMALAEGNEREAVELLAPVYESFVEGASTEDLKRSARLLTAAGANRLTVQTELGGKR
jgi:tetratricopeptide (TPR) repeat protein